MSTTRDPRNWRTEHAVLQATVDARRELAREVARIAPAPTGSREISRWLQAVLLVLTAFVIAAFAPGAQAAGGGSASATFLEAVTADVPINCQGDVDYAATIPLADWLPPCGYRYDWPAASPLPLPPVIAPHTPAVPEPAAWMLMLAGLGVLLLVLLVRALRAAIELDNHTEGQP